MTVAPIAGIVLAAGRSTRMGSPKPLLELGGETFLARAVRVLRHGGCGPVVAVVPPAQAEGPMGEIARAGGAVAIENPEPGAEPIDSIQIGLGEMEDDTVAVVILPVDVPVAGPDAVRALIAAWREVPAVIARPTHGGKPGHPVLFARAVWEELADPDLEHGARDVVHRHHKKILEVEVDDAGVLVDIDTLEDYRRTSSP